MAKLTPEQKLDLYKPKLPKLGAYSLAKAAAAVIQLFRPARCTESLDKKQWKGRPLLILACHASYDDPMHFAWQWRLFPPNAVMGKHHLFIPFLFRLYLWLGVVPKSLFEADVRAAAQILSLRRRGASILLYPEGVQSVAGCMMPLRPSTARLVKKLQMDTVLCSSHGAFLSSPRFDRHFRRGRLEYSYRPLFSAQEIAQMSEDVLYSRLLEALDYNDFLWNSEKQYRYRGRFPCAHGLDRLLIRCPRCGGEFTLRVEGDDLICSCGNTITVDDRYNLRPAEGSSLPFKRIDEWYNWQRAKIAEEALAEDFRLVYDAEYRMLITNKLRFNRFQTVGRGQVTLDRESLTYTGTKDGEDVTLTFAVSRIPSAPFAGTDGNEFYYDGIFRLFRIPDNPKLSVKVLIAIETLHNLTDPAQRKCYEDIYGKSPIEEM